MGRTVTPTYRLDFTVNDWYITPQGWDGRRYGRPTNQSLRRWIADFEASTQPGGANAHLGPLTVRSAWVTRQATHERMADFAGGA